MFINDQINAIDIINEACGDFFDSYIDWRIEWIILEPDHDTSLFDSYKVYCSC